MSDLALSPAEKDSGRTVSLTLHNVESLSAQADRGGAVARQEGPQEFLPPLPGLLIQVPSGSRVLSRLDEFGASFLKAYRMGHRADGRVLGQGPVPPGLNQPRGFIGPTGEERGQGAAKVFDYVSMRGRAAGVAGVDGVDVSRKRVGLHAQEDLQAACRAENYPNPLKFYREQRGILPFFGRDR